ncbi:MAG: hypothetical protein E7054_05105 [Lentisphaerae bacterium]|nr:hypothetical protein [Lentisphaerota bacterium]
MLRYRSTGELHKDFHILFCNTLHYLQENFGETAVEEVLKNTAQNVYRSMYEKLLAGDTSELLEYWDYYLKRENAAYTVENFDDGIRLTVHSCPLLSHLKNSGLTPDPIACQATVIFNDSLCENSPFTAEFEKTGEFSCCQILRKKVTL